MSVSLDPIVADAIPNKIEPYANRKGLESEVAKGEAMLQQRDADDAGVTFVSTASPSEIAKTKVKHARFKKMLAASSPPENLTGDQRRYLEARAEMLKRAMRSNGMLTRQEHDQPTAGNQQKFRKFQNWINGHALNQAGEPVALSRPDRKRLLNVKEEWVNIERALKAEEDREELPGVASIETITPDSASTSVRPKISLKNLSVQEIVEIFGDQAVNAIQKLIENNPDLKPPTPEQIYKTSIVSPEAAEKREAEKKRTKKYDPEIHCGALTKAGKRCTLAKNFDRDEPHPEGYCKWH